MTAARIPNCLYVYAADVKPFMASGPCLTTVLEHEISQLLYARVITMCVLLLHLQWKFFRRPFFCRCPVSLALFHGQLLLNLAKSGLVGVKDGYRTIGREQ